MIRALLRLACARAGIPLREGPLLVRRGPYLTGCAQDRGVELSGVFLDVLDPDLPLLENPHLPYEQGIVYKEVLLTPKMPALLHSTYRATVQEASPQRLRLRMEGPAGAEQTLRVYTGGMSLAGCEAADETGPRPAAAKLEGRTVLIRTRQGVGPLNLTMRWIRPEARLTK